MTTGTNIEWWIFSVFSRDCFWFLPQWEKAAVSNQIKSLLEIVPHSEYIINSNTVFQIRLSKITDSWKQNVISYNRMEFEFIVSFLQPSFSMQSKNVTSCWVSLQVNYHSSQQDRIWVHVFFFCNFTLFNAIKNAFYLCWVFCSSSWGNPQLCKIEARTSTWDPIHSS